jgi:hypothetical protein
MGARYTRKLTLFLLAFSLGATACGNSSPGKDGAAAKTRAAARWQRGLLAWHGEMQHALDEISVLLSTQESLATLGEPASRTHAAMTRFERTLAHCAATVERLGPEPPGLAAARGYALTACASLERGDRLLEAGVRGLSRGLAVNFESASDPLSDGQGEMEIVMQTLESDSVPATNSG